MLQSNLVEKIQFCAVKIQVIYGYDIAIVVTSELECFWIQDQHEINAEASSIKNKITDEREEDSKPPLLCKSSSVQYITTPIMEGLPTIQN